MLGRTFLAMTGLAALATLLLTGCGGGPRSIAGETPQATAQAFIDAMAQEQYESIARGWDFEAYARRQNPDWDTFGESQRNLIVQKLRDDQVSRIEAMAGIFAGGAQIGEPEQGPGRAIVPITAGGRTMRMSMTERDGLWYITNIQ